MTRTAATAVPFRIRAKRPTHKNRKDKEMAIAVPAPRQALVDLRDAFSEWRIGRRTGGLTTLELHYLVGAAWSCWREGHPERQAYCQRHDRLPSLKLTEAHLLEGGGIKLTCLEHCPGDYDLRESHSILPHDFTVPRGRWSEIKELGVAA